MDKEFIICAAIWLNDRKQHEEQPENIEEGFVICGRRHNNCYQTIKILTGDVNNYIKSLNLSEEGYRDHQGFMTSTDRYVNRKEGWKIATANNQIQFGEGATDPDNLLLISEHLY